VSALLAEATSDAVYLQAAIESADFFQAQLYTSDHIALDSVSGRANDSCHNNRRLAPYNSGLLLEGLAVLYSVTGNLSIQTL
ncbi:hypothetical protein B0H13DRAFT_1635654, partial [Mycena leptocephala]